LGRQEAKFLQIQAIKTLRDVKLEIDTNDELDDMPNGEFEVDEGANFKVKVKTNEDFKIEEEDQNHTQQEDHCSPSQNDQDLTQHKNQDYSYQEGQDNPHHNDLVSLNTIIHYEALMKIILQDTSYDDSFLYMCHFFRLHPHLDARRTLLGSFFLWPRRPPPKSNILIVHFVFPWTRRPPSNSNIFFFSKSLRTMII
jgi:hypothetical protein